MRNLIGRTPPYDGSTDPQTDPRFTTVMGDGVFRLEFCFQLEDGTYSNQPILRTPTPGFPSSATFFKQAGSAPTLNDGEPTYAVGSRWWFTNGSNQRGYICVSSKKGDAKWALIGSKDISAVVVGIVVLERENRKILKADATYPNQVDAVVMSNLTRKFADPTDTDVAGTPAAGPRLMGQIWNDKMNSGTIVSEMQAIGVPPAVTAQIRVYQRTFPLHTKYGAL